MMVTVLKKETLNIEIYPDKDHALGNSTPDDMENIETDQMEKSEGVGIPLRDKTFTPELKGLVEQITTHEREKTEEISEDNLLERFHRLFYRAINLPGLNKMNTLFNPYDLQGDAGEADIRKSIDTALAALNIHEYLLLTYNFQKRCYLPYISNPRDITEVNIAIDASERLYKEIAESRRGIILGPERINNDQFLKKRFSPHDGGDVRDYYFILSIGRLFSGMFLETPVSAKNLAESCYPFPLLLLTLSGDNRFIESDGLYQEILNRLTVPLFLAVSSAWSPGSNDSPLGFYDYYYLFDYLVSSYALRDDGIIFSVQCNRWCRKENLFLERYLLSKLVSELPGKPMAVQIEKDLFYLFTKRSLSESFLSIFNEINDLYNGEFTVKEFLISGKRGPG